MSERATTAQDAQLATDYEAIRRREYELIMTLLDVLPKIDGLDTEQVAQVRDALFHADHPYLMVFVGPFSSGKSSLINALVSDTDLLAVGPVPTTDTISILRWGEEHGRMRSGDVDTVFHPSPLLKKVSFVDTPGLESVFQKHEETTRRFLHRSDTVLLVMLATQAMTARNVEYLRMLREYGKNVIVIINQSDLLTTDEQTTVRDYVLEQAQSQLGFRPTLWLMSAKLGAAARDSEPFDAARWADSGLHQVEQYIDEQLGDINRLRQKLQTPLQITQNVTNAALQVVRANQSALDHYQSIAANIDQQLAAQRREQDRIVRETTDAVALKFTVAAERGGDAIRDVFRFSRAARSFGRGVAELVGLGRLARGESGWIRTAFERQKAFEPVDELPEVVGKLAPRLEGKDVQDLDDLVKYGRREIDALPDRIREKVIGSVQAPLQYDRSALQAVRPALEQLEDAARTVETDTLEAALRNTVLYLAAWELLVIVFFIALLATWGSFGGDQAVFPLVVLGILILAALVGLALVPLRGRALQAVHQRRLLKLQADYIDTLSKAADRQVSYGVGLRRDVVAPLTRLVEAQTQLQTEQLVRLQAAQQEVTRIEADLTALGKRPMLAGLLG